MIYITDFMDLSLIPKDGSFNAVIEPISAEEVKAMIDDIDNVGSFFYDRDILMLVGFDLDVEIGLFKCVERVLQSGDSLIVSFYSGPDIPTFPYKLPSGGKIDYWMVRLLASHDDSGNSKDDLIALIKDIKAWDVETSLDESKPDFFALPVELRQRIQKAIERAE